MRYHLLLFLLLLALNPGGQVLSGLPINPVALGVVVDEVTTVAALGLVVVGLGESLVVENSSRLNSKMRRKPGLSRYSIRMSTRCLSAASSLSVIISASETGSSS